MNAFTHPTGSNPNLLFTRQERIVHGVLARALLAAQVRRVVQLICSCRAEYWLVE
jgi:hypothetical protein